jgi:hypothetical protein
VSPRREASPAIAAPAPGRSFGIDLALLFAVKAAVGAYVLRAGFTHVSDDDYARTVIAQQFAHHPALDPSGTSWLPFPFWVTGGAMLALGRSLVVAQGVAFVLGVVSIAAPYSAMRVVGCGRATALAAVGLALALPWSAWLGVATVPEAPTACLVGAAAIAVTSPSARVPASIALLAASLSRYEAWPACAVFAAICLLAARSEPTARAKNAAAGALALLGPLAWMLWNLHAHGSALHFVTRVTSYRQSTGAAAIPLSEKLTTFPLALASSEPVLLALSLAGALALPLDPALRRRWLPPLVSAGAILAFLVYGDAHDGAPTHHPERALLPVVWILAPFAADSLRALARRFAWARPRREMWVFGVSVAGGLAWLALLPARLRDAPGMSAGESRSAQIERGNALPPSASALVTPCAYEHFALLAATGAPERFTVLPPSHAPVTPACPRVELR